MNILIGEFLYFKHNPEFSAGLSNKLLGRNSKYLSHVDNRDRLGSSKTDSQGIFEVTFFPCARGGNSNSLDIFNN